MPTPRKISDFKPLFTNLAQSSHFQVIFGGLPQPLLEYLYNRGIDSRFITNDLGLLCFSAVLPTTSLSTTNISGNFMGIQEKIAHTRIYPDITLEFYVDKDYKVVKFLEHWMEFISSGSHNPVGTPALVNNLDLGKKNYFIRMQYPDYYKAETAKIVKFDRDYAKEIEYNFVGMFPSNMSSISVSYTSSQVLTASATFSIDRYIAGRRLSLDFEQRINNNLNPSNSTENQVGDIQEIFKNIENGRKFEYDSAGKLNFDTSNELLSANVNNVISQYVV